MFLYIVISYILNLCTFKIHHRIKKSHLTQCEMISLDFFNCYVPLLPILCVPCPPSSSSLSPLPPAKISIPRPVRQQRIPQDRRGSCPLRAFRIPARQSDVILGFRWRSFWKGGGFRFLGSLASGLWVFLQLANL